MCHAAHLMFYYEKEIKTSNSNCLQPSSEISTQLWNNTQLCTTLYQQTYCIPHTPKTCHLKGTVHPKNLNYIFSLVPVALFIHLHCFGVSCTVEMTALGLWCLQWQKKQTGNLKMLNSNVSV